LAKQKEKLKRAKEAEKKQLAEEKKKQLAEKRRLEEQEQKRKEMSLKLKLKAEELSLKQSLLKRDYMIAIKEQVERNWRRPQESSKIESCEVRVLQGPGGIIMDVTFGDCDGGTSAYRRSIENAVYKAEPLPQPGDKTLFEREINFIFTPK
jgi:colicin import membrane protein